MYLAHNSAFLAYSAAMEGRKAETLVAVQDVAATLPVPMLVTMQRLRLEPSRRSTQRWCALACGTS